MKPIFYIILLPFMPIYYIIVGIPITACVFAAYFAEACNDPTSEERLAKTARILMRPINKEKKK